VKYNLKIGNNNIYKIIDRNFGH